MTAPPRSIKFEPPWLSPWTLARLFEYLAAPASLFYSETLMTFLVCSRPVSRPASLLTPPASQNQMKNRFRRDLWEFLQELSTQFLGTQVSC